MLPTPGSPIALDLKDIPRAPSPFLHGWASVNQKTYPYPFPQLTRPPSTPLGSDTPLPTRKKPKAVNPFLPKQLIKPTTIHPATFNLPSQIKPPPVKAPEAENTTKKESEIKPEAVASDVDSDDGWGLDLSPGDTAQAFIDRELDVLMSEDLKRIPPAMPSLDSVAVEEERKQFGTELRFDPDLLEIVVRAALLSKILLDARRQHAKRVIVLNDFKSATAGRNPEYATLYETELTASVKAVEALQAQLNSALKFCGEDVKFHLEEFVVKHERLLSETEPAVWVAKKPVKPQSALPKIHPTRTNIATASASQQGAFSQADDTWASNSFQPAHSGGGAVKSGMSASGLDAIKSSGGDEWGAAPSKPSEGTDNGAWGSGPKSSGQGQKSDWGNSGGGGFESSGMRGRGSWGVGRGDSSGTGHNNSTGPGRGRGRGGSEMGNPSGGWHKKEQEDSGNGRSNDDWGGNNTSGGGNAWGNNDDSGAGSRGFGWASRGRGRGRGRGDENGGNSGWSAGGRGRGGNDFSGGGGGGCDSGWGGRGRGRGRGGNDFGGGFGSRGGASERASFNSGDAGWGGGETGSQKSLGDGFATTTEAWGEEKKDKQNGEGVAASATVGVVSEEAEEHSGWSP